MKRLLFFLLMIFFSAASYGQTSHYWTESYGTRSMLLNGVVIGSVQDLGAVYYNPARLSQFKSPAFVISGQVYQLSGIKLRNALGDGIDLSNTKFGGGPSLVSGTFDLKFMKKSKFAYAFLTRVQTRNNFSYSVDEFGDYVAAFPGNEYFSGEITSKNEMSDEWMGLSWSYPITEKWSVGVTGFYSNLTRNAGLRLQLQAFSPDSASTGMYIDQREYSYSSHSILGKFGVSYKGERVTAGMTITTPKLEGVGSAGTKFETFLAGIDTTGDGNNEDIYILNNQSGLEQTHRTPWSIGIGSGIRVGKRSLVHLTAQWYSAIPSYTLIDSESFIGQSTGEEYKMTVVDKLGSVINYGVGLEVYINPHLSLFGSYATDFSAVQSEPDFISDLGLTVTDNNLRADKQHIGFGTDIKTNFADLTIGAMYAFSREKVKRQFSIDDGQNPTTEDIEIYYTRWRFLIGFEFHFVDNIKEKLQKKDD